MFLLDVKCVNVYGSPCIKKKVFKNMQSSMQNNVKNNYDSVKNPGTFRE